MLASVALAVASLALSAQQSAVPAAPALQEAQALRAANEALRSGRLDEADAALSGIAEAARGFEWHHLQLSLFCARSSASSGAVAATTRWSHGAAPKALDLSPDDRLLAVGLEDGRVLLHDARDGTLVASCATTSAAATCVRFTPDGSGLLVGQADGALRQYALDGGLRLAYPAGERAVESLSFADDRVASLSADGVLRVHRVASAETLSALREFGSSPRACAWLSGDALLVAGDDGRVRSWSTRSGDPLAEWSRADGVVQALLVRGERIWLGGAFAARLAAATQDAAQAPSPMPGPRADVLALACSADGARLAAGCADGAVWLYDAAGGAVRCALRPASGPVVALDFDSAGTRLAVAADGAVLVLETRLGVARRAQRDPLPPLPRDEEVAGLRAHQLEKTLLAHVARDNRTKEHWARVQALAQAGLARFPQSGRLQTALGGAQLRSGDAPTALATLEQAQQLDRGLPHNLALRALALAKLGREDEGRALRTKLLVLLAEPRWSGDEDVRALADETAAALPATPRRGVPQQPAGGEAGPRGR